MTTRNILLLVVLVSFGLLSQYCPDFSQQKAGRIGTDVVVINEKSFDPKTLKKDLEKKNEALTSEKALPKNPKKDEANQKKPTGIQILKQRMILKALSLGKISR